MFLVLGKYRRQVRLPETSATCPQCYRAVQVQWLRTWKTLHFFWFPFLSMGEEHVATCPLCGHTQHTRYPGQLPLLPFLDRLGFVFLLGLVVFGPFLLLGALILVAKLAPAPSPDSSTAATTSAVTTNATSVRRAAEDELSVGRVGGNTADASELAERIVDELEKKLRYRRSDLAVHVRLVMADEAGASGAVLVFCEHKQLRHVKEAERRELAEVVEKVLDAERERAPAVVSVKGTFLYGILATRADGGEWSTDVSDPVPMSNVDTAVSKTLR